MVARAHQCLFVFVACVNSSILKSNSSLLGVTHAQETAPKAECPETLKHRRLSEGMGPFIKMPDDMTPKIGKIALGA